MDRDFQGVVGAGEQEFRAAGDGAEFADDQPVLVDRVVVEDVVLLEGPGIVAEVVVHGKVAHLNGGVGDDVFR